MKDFSLHGTFIKSNYNRRRPGTTKVTYIGLDDDDTQHHGSALYTSTGEVINFKCRLMLEGLLGQ